MILPSPSEPNPSNTFPPIDFQDSKAYDYADGPSSPNPMSPPRYRSLRRPAAPITYVFTPQPSNAMLLVPPPDAKDSQRPYHISVSLNCFTPTSYITVVRKTAWDGEIVGDFEIGGSTSQNQYSGTLCLRGNEFPISELLESTSHVYRTTWHWKVKSFGKGADKPMSLFWDDYQGGGVLSCYSSPDRNASNLLAQFTPRAQLRRQGQPMEPPKLLVTSVGHDLFDDVLLSALVIERIRTAPSRS